MVFEGNGQGLRAAMEDGGTDDEGTDLLSELGRLKEEHRDLDGAIEALKLGIVGDQLQIQRLKKRKLFLRDRIAHLEDQIHPDIIA